VMNMTFRAQVPLRCGALVMRLAGAVRLSHRTLEIESGACAGTAAAAAVRTGDCALLKRATTRRSVRRHNFIRESCGENGLAV
jgi:hypothetical protein